MGQITSLFVRKVAAATDPSIDQTAVLAKIGIDQTQPIDPSQMVPDTTYYDWLEMLARTEPDGTTLPLRVGATMHCDDYGAFGLAWKTAANLLGSFERASRYARVLTSVASYEVERCEEGAFMCLLRDGERRLGLRLSNEATMASIFSISRQVCSTPFQATAVYFKHDAPKSITDHEEYFACPVYFGSDKDAVLVANGALNIPNKLADQGLSQFLQSHLDSELNQFEEEISFNQQVLQQISNSLSEGVPTTSRIGAQLHMSGRTLQRRLAEDGSTFQNLVDEARRQLAEKLLRQTTYSLADIAFMTGFSDQSTFTRAFKRWAGQTPRSFRIGSQ